MPNLPASVIDERDAPVSTEAYRPSADTALELPEPDDTTRVWQLRDGRRVVAHELLGKGGFAAVYRGELEGEQEPVAIKALRPLPLDDPRCAQAQARWQREAQLLTELADVPGVPRCYGSSEHAQRPALVLQHIAGVTVHTLLRQRQKDPLPLPESLNICQQLAATVAQLHARGILHGDLTPNNVMVIRSATNELIVKLIDFGLSRNVYEVGPRLTQAGMTVGTPGYLHPAYIDAGVDRALEGDIFTLGCTFYELLTGQPLFSRQAWNTLVDKRLLVERGKLSDPEFAAACADQVTTKLEAVPVPHPALNQLIKRMLVPEIDAQEVDYQLQQLSAEENQSWWQYGIAIVRKIVGLTREWLSDHQ